jgi:hypothetical protein
VQPDTGVPSFLPQMNALPEMLGQFAERRMQLMRIEQAKAADDARQAHMLAQDDIANKRMGRLDARDATNDEFAQQKFNQENRTRASKAVGSGLSPGTMVYWKNGKPVTVKYKFVGGQAVPVDQPAQSPMADQPDPFDPQAAPPAAPPAQPEVPPEPQPEMQPPPTMGGRPLSMPQLRSPSLAGGPLPPSQPQPAPQQPQDPVAPPPQVAPPSAQDAELEALMQGAQQPAPPPEAPQGDSVFFDAAEDGNVRALSGPDDGTMTQLPIGAFPPGAKEGDRFNASDVNMKGGMGNPFSGPIPPTDSTGLRNKLLPSQSAPESSSTFIPAQQIRGASARMPQAQAPQGGRWVAYDDQGNEVDSIDPSEARAAREADAMDEERQIQKQLASAPDTPEYAQVRQGLLNRSVLVRSGMSPQMQAQLQRDAATGGRQGAQIASNEGIVDKKIGSTEGLAANKIASTEGMAAATLASREKLAAEANATRLATSKYGRGGKGGGKVTAQSSGSGSAFASLKPMEQARIENATNNGIRMLDSQMNWTKLEGAGFDRLNLALQNIRAKGDLGGAQQMEAMMNFFGYIRGGVPAKNETDEFKSITRTLGTTLDTLGQKVGLKDLWTNFTGSESDKAAIAKIAQLPEGQRAGLEQAIVESQRAIQGMALKNITAQVEGYKSAGQPFHERIQDKINAKLRFIGEKPRQWFQDSKLIPDFEPGAAVAPAGATTAPSKPGNIDAKLDALQKLIGP